MASNEHKSVQTRYFLINGYKKWSWREFSCACKCHISLVTSPCVHLMQNYRKGQNESNSNRSNEINPRRVYGNYTPYWTPWKQSSRLLQRNTIILLSKFDDVQGGSLGWRWGVHSIPWQKGRVGKSSMLKQIVKGRFEENETTTTEASNYKKTVKVDNTVAVSSLASLNSL